MTHTCKKITCRSHHAWVSLNTLDKSRIEYEYRIHPCIRCTFSSKNWVPKVQVCLIRGSFKSKCLSACSAMCSQMSTKWTQMSTKEQQKNCKSQLLSLRVDKNMRRDTLTWKSSYMGMRLLYFQCVLIPENQGKCWGACYAWVRLIHGWIR